MKLGVRDQIQATIISAVMALFLGLTPSTSVSANETASDVIRGAGAHYSWIVFDALKQELEEKSNRKITLFGKYSTLGIGCKAGIKMAKQNVPGRETFGFICCPLSDEEIEKEQLIVYPLAYEPIRILVNKSNPIDNLTAEQVRSVFRGEITNWKELGGLDKPIVIVTRLHCKKRPGHWKTILKSAKEFRSTRINVKSSKEMMRRISSLSSAFGHTGSTVMHGPDDKTKVITVDGLAPTAANLATKKYPFYRKLQVVTNRQPSDDVLAIIRTVQTGDSFQAVTKKYELLPILVDTN